MSQSGEALRPSPEPSDSAARRRLRSRLHDGIAVARRNPLTFVKAALAVGAVALALARLLAPGYTGERMDRTFLLLLAAAVLILLVPWEHLTTLKAAGLELTLNRPQVAGALRALQLDRIDKREIRETLESRAEKLDVLRGARVLWHDDVPRSTVGGRRLLRALGIDVVSVTDREAALNTLENDCDFDLVITDVLRRTDHGYKAEGLVLVREIREHPNPIINGLPIIFFTWGRTQEEAEKQVAKVSRMHPRPQVTISSDTLLRTVIDVLEDARKRPIDAPLRKEPT
jgi:CheY-like chemotaxis protein